MAHANAFGDFQLQVARIETGFLQGMPDRLEQIPFPELFPGTMDRRLDLKVKGGGLETEEQLSLLESLNCDVYQGYSFSRPLPADEMTELLHQHARP